MYNDDQPLNGSVADEKNLEEIDDVADESDEEEEDFDEEEYPDLLEATDENGNSVILKVVRYFFYNGEEYVALDEVHDSDCDCDCEHCAHHEGEEEDDEIQVRYYMKVVASEDDSDMDDFVPVEDEALLEELDKVVDNAFDSEEEGKDD